MSTTKINELPAAAGVASNDYLAIDNTSGVSQKVTAAQLVNVDDTLSVAGRPADAKATGDAISAEATTREEAARTLSTEVNDLETALKAATGITFMEFQPGVRNCANVDVAIGDVTLATGAYVHAIAPCTTNDIVTVKVRGADSARAWAYLDANYVVLMNGSPNAEYYDMQLPQPPEGTAFVLLNNRTGNTYLPSGYYGCVGAQPLKYTAEDVQALNDSLYYRPLRTDMFEIGTAWVASGKVSYGDGNGDVMRVKRFGTIRLEAGTVISVGTGYTVRVIKIVGGAASTVSNFTTQPITLTDSADYLLVFGTADGSPITVNIATLQNLYIKNISQNQAVIDTIFDEMNLGSFAYKYHGDRILPQRHGYNVSTEGAFTLQGGAIIEGSQGGAIYENILAITQDLATDKISLFDMTDHSFINSMTLSPSSFSHANSCQFSAEKVDAADALPLLYVARHSDQAVCVYRIASTTDTTATRVKLLELGSAAEVGNNVNIAVDKDMNRLISLGTFGASALDGMDNYMILSVYDLNNQTQQGTAYKPELLHRTTLPFIFCVQDCKYINGRIIVLSSADPNSTPYPHSSWIYSIAPYTGGSKAILKQFPEDMESAECEVIDEYTVDGKSILFVVTYQGKKSFAISFD